MKPIKPYLTVIFGLVTLTLAGCGGEDTQGSGSNNYLIPGTVLEGTYESVAKMNGYTVYNEIEVTPDSEFLGIASNIDDSSNQPKTIYRIIKGGMTATPLYEFDLVDPSINRYEVSGRQINSGDSIRFTFSNIPSSLIRPQAITAHKVTTPYTQLSSMIGYHDSATLSLIHRTASHLDIFATRYTSDTNKALSLVYTDNVGCKLEASIIKRDYQRQFADVQGQFAGNRCPYQGQYFKGLIGYNEGTGLPMLFGTMTNNSDALVVTVNP